jgi:hypothetical protein
MNPEMSQGKNRKSGSGLSMKKKRKSKPVQNLSKKLLAEISQDSIFRLPRY